MERNRAISVSGAKQHRKADSALAISVSGANQHRKAESALICEPMVSSRWAGIAVGSLEHKHGVVCVCVHGVWVRGTGT